MLKVVALPFKDGFDIILMEVAQVYTSYNLTADVGCDDYN